VAARSPFPTYLQMRARVPLWAWAALRVVGLLATAALLVALFVAPEIGLLAFWGVLIPALPLLFFVAPGAWRNACPLATLNQTPRFLRFTRALTLPKWLREHGYLVAIALFFVIIPARKLLFDHDGTALAVLLLATLAAAFLGGVFVRGKAGWCSTMCPLLPVQRLYGQTPFVTVRNAHCRPCVGCVKNCYDFNPAVAYMADLYDPDPHRSGYRKLFAGAFPGLIVAFYTMEGSRDLPIAPTYLAFAGAMLLSVGSFYVLEVLFRVTANKITALYAVAALTLFYLFNVPLLNGRLGAPLPPVAIWAIEAGILALAAVWLVRTYRKERPFVEQAITPKPARVGSPDVVARASRGAHRA